MSLAVSCSIPYISVRTICTIGTASFFVTWCVQCHVLQERHQVDTREALWRLSMRCLVSACTLSSSNAVMQVCGLAAVGVANRIIGNVGVMHMINVAATTTVLDCLCYCSEGMHLC